MSFGEDREGFFVEGEYGRMTVQMHDVAYGEVCVEMHTSDNEIWLDAVQLRALAKRLERFADDLDKGKNK